MSTGGNMVIEQEDKGNKGYLAAEKFKLNRQKTNNKDRLNTKERREIIITQADAHRS